MKKILFIQHASAFGGSTMSLLYTLKGIRNEANTEYELLIALAKWNPEIADFYIKNGFNVIKSRWIDTYEHTQLHSLSLSNPINWFKEIKQQILIFRALRNTYRLLNEIKPDIVHLNSVVLLGSALAVKLKKFPLVWHVREPSVKGVLGIRRFFIFWALNNLSDNSIFICRADRASWGYPKNSEVIYNFVDFNRFDFSRKKEYDKYLKLRDGEIKNILFLGGVSKVKGTIVLLEALGMLKSRLPGIKFRLLFPGGDYSTPQTLYYLVARFILKLLSRGTYSYQVENIISSKKLEPHILRMKYEKNPEELLAVSDILVFPSIRPHFARPIIEAQAMKVACIGSKLPGVEELIENNFDGLSVNTRNIEDLADAIEQLLVNIEFKVKLEDNAYVKAVEKFDQTKNIINILLVYEKLLKNT